YIHLNWIGPPTNASHGKCTRRCCITLKKPEVTQFCYQFPQLIIKIAMEHYCDQETSRFATTSISVSNLSASDNMELVAYSPFHLN
ncbi:hypothetical protein U9M48_003179, partial [Paspalum notatum var. saurae]